MMMRKTITFIALGLVLATQAPAQEKATGDNVAVRAGFYFGQSFESLDPGRDIKLEGLELGVDWTLMRFGQGARLRFSPSVMFGGINRKGGDTDGTLYRGLITGVLQAPDARVYGLLGGGYALSKPRGSARFDERKGFCGVVGAGYLFGKPGGTRPFLEIDYYFGNSQFSGGALSVGIRF